MRTELGSLQVSQLVLVVEGGGHQEDGDCDEAAQADVSHCEVMSLRLSWTGELWLCFAQQVITIYQETYILH